MTAIDLLPCPFCGKPAHCITPMGFWEKDTGYGPNGVRYVCSSLYEPTPTQCPGSATVYGEEAEEKAVTAWNTRALPTVQPDPLGAEWMRRKVVEVIIESAFFEGFGEGRDGTWIEGDPTYAWKKSDVFKELNKGK